MVAFFSAERTGHPIKENTLADMRLHVAVRSLAEFARPVAK